MVAWYQRKEVHVALIGLVGTVVGVCGTIAVAILTNYGKPEGKEKAAPAAHRAKPAAVTPSLQFAMSGDHSWFVQNKNWALPLREHLSNACDKATCRVVEVRTGAFEHNTEPFKLSISCRGPLELTGIAFLVRPITEGRNSIEYLPTKDLPNQLDVSVPEANAGDWILILGRMLNNSSAWPTDLASKIVMEVK